MLHNEQIMMQAFSLRKQSRSHQQRGFTIVELLIVIVVIGILAAITIVSYNGVASRAQDTQRASDLESIKEALEIYKFQDENNSYPERHIPNGALSSWEASSREPAGEFLKPLVDKGIMKSVPVDPINNALGTVISTEWAGGRFSYVYYYYAAGSGGCDTARGRFYVLAALNSKSTPHTTPHPQSPGFKCVNRDWQDEFSWVTGGFQY